MSHVDPLLLLYVSNASLLTLHEIDSAFWKEWNLFKPLSTAEPSTLDDVKGLNGFLIFHMPVMVLVFYGLIKVYQDSTAGLILSILLAACGISAFVIHMIFLAKGRPEFRAPVSLTILWLLLPASVLQAVLAAGRLM